MALQAQVRAADEGLVGAMGALQDAGGAGRDGEGLAVPVEGLEACGIPQPLRRCGIRRGLDRTPADLLDRVSRHRAAEGPGHELSAQAMADDGNSRRVGRANQLQCRLNPRQIVIHAHRSAHEAESRKSPGSRRWRHAFVDLEQFPRQGMAVEECGKIARALAGVMTEYCDRFHAGVFCKCRPEF